MNVDEAMARWKQGREMYDWPVFPPKAMDVVVAEVERLRAELAEAKASSKVWRDVSMKLQGTLLQQHDELAAAKAASVCPVEIAALGDADWEYSVGVKCKSDDDANKLFDWLWERMKDTPPPAT